MTIATATDVQNNFGRFLQYAIDGNEVIIMKNGKEVARIISREAAAGSLTDSLRGVLKNDYDDKAIRAERANRYDSAD